MDADTASIPLMAGDIVVMASDGLFDNLEISEIIAIVSEWEQGDDEGQTREEVAAEVLAVNNSYDSRCQALAKALVLAAREASLSKDKDRCVHEIICIINRSTCSYMFLTSFCLCYL